MVGVANSETSVAPSTGEYVFSTAGGTLLFK